MAAPLIKTARGHATASLFTCCSLFVYNFNGIALGHCYSMDNIGDCYDTSLHFFFKKCIKLDTGLFYLKNFMCIFFSVI